LHEHNYPKDRGQFITAQTNHDSKQTKKRRQVVQFESLLWWFELVHRHLGHFLLGCDKFECTVFYTFFVVERKVVVTGLTLNNSIRKAFLVTLSVHSVHHINSGVDFSDSQHNLAVTNHTKKSQNTPNVHIYLKTPVKELSQTCRFCSCRLDPQLSGFHHDISFVDSDYGPGIS
jgi:hypothetical protein